MITLENVKAYTTSKNNVEVILNGEYTTNGKVLNGRQRYEDANGKVFWVPSCKPDGELHYDVVETADSDIDDSISSTQVESRNEEPLMTVSVVQDKVPDTKVAAIYHTVSRGDTYASIAAKYNVPISQIMFKGDLVVGNQIRVK